MVLTRPSALRVLLGSLQAVQNHRPVPSVFLAPIQTGLVQIFALLVIQGFSLMRRVHLNASTAPWVTIKTRMGSTIARNALLANIPMHLA